MNRDTVIALAREAGDEEWRILIKQVAKHFPDELERFAALVAAHEREECAKVCEELKTESDAEFYGHEFAAAIRSRT